MKGDKMIFPIDDEVIVNGEFGDMLVIFNAPVYTFPDDILLFIIVFNPMLHIIMLYT